MNKNIQGDFQICISVPLRYSNRVTVGNKEFEVFPKIVLAVSCFSLACLQMGCVSLNPKFQYIQYSSTPEEMPPGGKFTLKTMFT